jgi:hypothetical protein
MVSCTIFHFGKCFFIIINTAGFSRRAMRTKAACTASSFRSCFPHSSELYLQAIFSTRTCFPNKFLSSMVSYTPIRSGFAFMEYNCQHPQSCVLPLSTSLSLSLSLCVCVLMFICLYVCKWRVCASASARARVCAPARTRAHALHGCQQTHTYA